MVLEFVEKNCDDFLKVKLNSTMNSTCGNGQQTFEMGMVRIRFCFMPLPLFRRNSRKKTDIIHCMCKPNSSW